MKKPVNIFPGSRVPQFSWPPAAARRLAKHARPSSWTSSTQQHEGFPGKRPRSQEPATHVIDKDPHARPGYWRHRVNANRGGSEGRDARCKGLAHAGRAAAPNRPHSSFSDTCCPYAARSAFLLCKSREARALGGLNTTKYQYRSGTAS